jgi:amino acid transporter
VAPVAEEAHTPRRLIPLATILITLTAGAYGWAVWWSRRRQLDSISLSAEV